MRPHTVRARIALLAALTVMVVLVGVSFALVLVQRRSLTDHLDQTLSDRADELSLSLAAGAVPDDISGLGDDDTVAQVVTADGRIVATSSNASGVAPLGPASTSDRDVVHTVHLPTDTPAYRLLSRRIDGPGGAYTVLVAASLDDIDESVRLLQRSLLVIVPAVGLLLATLVWWLAGRALRPVEAMRAEVQRMSGTEWQARLPEPPGDDEIARLARTMNSMLGRVRTATERQQHFVADASHELRSPLARMRAELEVDLAHPGGADVARTHRSVLEEVRAMERLVDDLLELARVDATGARPASATTEVIDLRELTLDAAEHVTARGRRRVDTSGVREGHVRGDGRQLARLIRNLMENAERHAHSVVRVAVAEVGSHAVLTVADDGPGIPPDQRQAVFERFTRLDTARSSADGGTGLGLAIAQAIVEAHGGVIAVDADESGGARFTVTLPLADRQPTAG